MEESMREERQEELEQKNAPKYRPRPKWQIVLAWVGLGVMIVSVALYYYHIASGGKLWP